MQKRLLVLFLSFGTIIAYGYALGGLGGYMFGEGRPMVIAAGLLGGTALAVAALKIWRIYLDDIEREDCSRDKKELSDHESDPPEEK